MSTLHNMFVLDLPVLEKVLRPILVYAVLVLLLRMFGKRELAQLNPFDLVVLLCLSNTVQNAIIGNDNSVSGGVIGAISLLCTNYITVRFLLQHRRLDQIMAGKPALLVHQGKIQYKVMAKEMITTAELAAVAHRQGLAGLDDVKECVLEPNGTFAIESKSKDAGSTRQVLLKLDAIEKQIAELREALER